MPKKSCKRNYNDCCNPCEYHHYIQWCNPCLCPLPPPTLLTNIAVSGTGPFGPSVGITFTVTNTTLVVAENVNVSISANQAVTPGAITISVGSYVNPAGTSLISWNIGTLLGGQSATITFIQVGVGITATTWTAVGATTTPEITLVDNTASVIVPLPQ